MLVTQNVDDLHTRAGLPSEQMVQIHGDIFVTRCSRCDFEHKQDDGNVDLSECPICHAFMRPGVVWFGEQLDPRKIDMVEEFLGRGPCDLVFVIGTTALFGYIVDWAKRAGGRLIEINPSETALSKFATEHVPEPAAIALPRIVNETV